MPWNALADRILTGGKRKKELEVENQSEYAQWVSELYSEIEVFVKRVNALDLSEVEGREQFYEFGERFSERLQELRNRSQSSAVPTEVLIQLEELIEQIDETSPGAAASVVYMGDDPLKKAKMEQERKERREERTEEVRKERDMIANEIQELTAAFDEYTP